ncbi:MAG: shikimate dehydrogenase [Rhodoferax sp.]
MNQDQYCVMGNPVGHSRSPWIHTRFAELTGQSLHYDRREVPLNAFKASVEDFRALGGRGCNVTVPFKLEAAALATVSSQRVQLAQAANVLSFDGHEIRADNTDGVGLVNDIEHNVGCALRGLRVLLVGAGGAAAGALGPLIEAAPARIVLANRTLDKAQQLVQRHQALAALHKVELFAQSIQGLDDIFDVVINATASSLGGERLPIPERCLRAGTLAYDMMYGPAAQPFLDWARLHGAHAFDGLGMLVEQAAEAFALWRGVRPPVGPVLEELRQQLAQASR